MELARFLLDLIEFNSDNTLKKKRCYLRMFSRTLTEVDRLFPQQLCTGFDKESWREKQRDLLDIFNEDLEPLIEICHAERFHNLLEESKFEQIIWPLNQVKINEFVIRPQNQYYTTLKKEIPQPDNPDGPHATGIQLSVGVLRSISGEKVCYPASVEVGFEIWGDAERKAFILFYKNYRRPFELLLRGWDLSFTTACYFKNLEKAKDKDLIGQLDLYFANRKDPENCFSIKKSFNRNAAFNSISTVFRKLLIIYYCCFGYCKRKRNLDRLLNFIDDFA